MTMPGTQLGIGGGKGFPCPFLRIEKKCPDFRKKGPDCVHLYVKFTIQNVVLRVSKRKKLQIFSLRDLFFWNFLRNVYQSALISRNLPCPKNFWLPACYVIADKTGRKGGTPFLTGS